MGQHWWYHPIEDCPGDNQIQKIGSPNHMTLERLEPKEAQETLGVIRWMTGDNSRQVEELRYK